MFGAEVLLLLLLKAVVTALVAVGISVAIENSGPVVGGVLMGLPITAGPGYVFLALQSTPGFVAQSALSSFAIVSANIAYVVIFVLVAKHARRLATTLACLAGWLVCAVVVREAPSPLWVGLALNSALFVVSIPLIRAPRPIGKFGRRVARRELLLRALGAGTLVAAVVTVSEAVGSSITGIAMLFPVTLITVGWVMLTRYGPEEAISVMTGALIALPGFALSVLTLALLAERIGVAVALILALALCLGWAGATLWFRRGSRASLAAS